MGYCLVVGRFEGSEDGPARGETNQTVKEIEGI